MAETTAARDERTGIALEHWAPRLLANGVDASDFREVTAGIARWDDWCPAWSARAAVHEALGREAAAARCTLSAGEHLARAGLYYHFAKFLFMHDRAQMQRAHARAVQCRRDALAWLQPPGARVEIPYEGRYLAGILRKPAGIEQPPVVIMVVGLDSAKEEMGAYEAVFLARGMATLAFDGPGQGEGEYEFALRGDYEVPVGAVLDYLGTRVDIERDRIGVWGVSLGGYYASRAAAFHPRIRACVALSGPYDWADGFDARNALTREAFRIRSRCKTAEAAKAAAREHSLAGVASGIRCPLLVIAGGRDTLVPPVHAQRLAAEAGGRVDLWLIEEGNHVVNNRPYRYRPQTGDWMATQLRASSQAQEIR